MFSEQVKKKFDIKSTSIHPFPISESYLDAYRAIKLMKNCSQF